MPEILKSSRSCTTFSRLGSFGSVFLTWKETHTDTHRVVNVVINDQLVTKCSVLTAVSDLQIWAAWFHPGLFLCNVQHFLQSSWPQSVYPWGKHNTQTLWLHASQPLILNYYQRILPAFLYKICAQNAVYYTGVGAGLTGRPRPTTQWRSAPNQASGWHGTSHWRDLQSSHGGIHLTKDRHSNTDPQLLCDDYMQKVMHLCLFLRKNSHN